MCVCVCEEKPDLFHVKIRRVGSWARRKQKPHGLKKTEGRQEEGGGGGGGGDKKEQTRSFMKLSVINEYDQMNGELLLYRVISSNSSVV